eukprot:m.221866 g.221866  ORF g.221866 m.221866 type:complete len:77 (-) comp18726_c4_seq5:39-269(-)
MAATPLDENQTTQLSKRLACLFACALFSGKTLLVLSSGKRWIDTSLMPLCSAQPLAALRARERALLETNKTHTTCV